nr:sn1-specific diacylglycerol lipase beta isoform X1 [Ipomoea batatas]
MISVVSRSIQQSDRSGFSEHPTVLGISVVMAAEASLPSCGRADIAAISAIALVSCAGVYQKASALTILSQNSNSDPNKRQERRYDAVLVNLTLRTAMDEDEVYGFLGDLVTYRALLGIWNSGQVVGKDRCFYLSENLDEKDDNTFWIQKDDREYPYELGHGLSEGA